MDQANNLDEDNIVDKDSMEDNMVEEGADMKEDDMAKGVDNKAKAKELVEEDTTIEEQAIVDDFTKYLPSNPFLI